MVHSPKMLLTALICASSLSLIGAGTIAPKLKKIWPTYAFKSIGVGNFAYQVKYSHDTLGAVSFPEDDSKGKRVMTLPDASLGTAQFQESAAHELLHACMHNHDHEFLSEEQLKAHLQKKMYTEEDVVEIIAPCLLAEKQKESAGGPSLLF